MNKYFATFLVGMLSLLPLQAQRTWWLPWKKAPAASTVSRAAQLSVSRQLEQRVTTTFRQAYQVQKQNPQAYQVLPFGEPVRSISQPDELDPRELYPQKSFLKNSKQTALYIAARSNRLLLQEMRRAETLGHLLEQALPELKQAAQAFQQPQEWIPWLVQQIPPQTQYLFIGEEHGYSEIHSATIQLLQGLRATYPERSIMLFTEFLPENLQWSAQTNIKSLPPYYVKLTPIWNEALAQHIAVIGLEPACATHEECKVRITYPSSYFTRRMSVWATLEGVRLRNERWVSTLAKYRAQFPDALFVVHSGFDHCMYNRPFALSNHYDPAHTFVATLHPNVKASYQKRPGRLISEEVIEPKPGPLERLVGQPDFPQQVLYWKDPSLAHLSGFNVRVKVPVTLND